MAKQDTSTKDIWGKLDVIFKGILGLLISGAIAFYGIQSDRRQTKISEANRQSQILVQTMNNRETSASQMRTQMFNTLMEHYFKEKDDETQIVILKLIGLNFQDHLYLKPLFERLDAKLIKNPDYRKELRKAANHIKRTEIDNIVGNGGEVIECELARGDTCACITADSVIVLNLTLLEVQEDRIRVTSDSDNDKDGFEVNYYDTPFMDNSRLGELTYSVLLSRIDTVDTENKVKIKVVILPKHYYSTRNTLRFDSMIGDLLEKEEVIE